MNPYILLVFVLMLGGAVWFWFDSLKNKVKIIYTRRTGQEIEKKIKITDEHVVFDSKRFDILPERHRISWVSLLGLFGTWILTYHFVWYSRFPENPNEYGITTASPEIRHALNQVEKFGAYQKAERDRYKDVKKGFAGGITQWLPLIAILGVVVIGYMVYRQNADMNIMKKALQDILTSGGK